MYPIFFNFDDKSDRFVYTEAGVTYRMPLLSMLNLKKFLRENFRAGHALPIYSWYSNLEREEALLIQIERCNKDSVIESNMSGLQISI
jgi:hypothetical protein